jgi:hypothetical protein
VAKVAAAGHRHPRFEGDVEAERNGLLTCDRKVVKVDAKQVAEAHGASAEEPCPPPSRYWPFQSASG